MNMVSLHSLNFGVVFFDVLVFPYFEVFFSVSGPYLTGMDVELQSTLIE